MTPAAARAAYARQMDAHGERVSLVRGFGGVSVTTVANVRARVRGYEPDDLVGAIQQGERMVILLAADLEGTALPVPAVNDRILWNGKALAVKEVDDSTRRVAGVMVAFELKVQGA